MFVKKLPFRMAEAGGNGEGSGGTLDLNSPEVQALLKSKVDAEVAGLKAKNAELLDKMAKVKTIDPTELEKLMALKAQVEANEEMKLMSEGKLEDVLSRRMDAFKRDAEHKYGALDSRAKELEQALKDREEKLKAAVVDGSVREAFLQLDLEPVAMNDEIRNARDIFAPDENGDIVPKDRSGNIIYGKDGKTPISIVEWLESQADKKPYLRKPSTGGGARPVKGGAKDTTNMSSTQRIAEGLRQMGRS